LFRKPKQDFILAWALKPLAQINSPASVVIFLTNENNNSLLMLSKNNIEQCKSKGAQRKHREKTKSLI